MSRTYRKYPVIKYHWKKKFYDSYKDLCKEAKNYEWGMGSTLFEDFDVKSKDSKPWFKPNKDFKTVMKKIRRAKERSALINGKDIPKFNKENVWNWT